jgi:hypothetical protein
MTSRWNNQPNILEYPSDHGRKEPKDSSVQYLEAMDDWHGRQPCIKHCDIIMKVKQLSDTMLKLSKKLTLECSCGMNQAMEGTVGEPQGTQQQP